MNCEIASETRVGGRPYNEDRLACWRTEEAVLLALADGLGGHAHGDLAAELAVAELAAAFHDAARPRLANPDRFLFRSFARVHALLGDLARKRSLSETPRTTLVACVVQDGCAYWMHVGDSRLYLLRDRAVAARTVDQTLVQELVASGRITEREARTHPQRNVLLQCLGGPLPPRLKPASMAMLRGGDVVLLCSDGFSGPLSARDMDEALRAMGLQEGLKKLAGMAEGRAGAQCDNLSVLALSWREEALPSDAEIEREIERIRRAFRMQWALHEPS
ncbi:MAG TPA: PP2C family serine/threonine-protein phosphatase [Burkholderiales bacterium]|nr:PP2C family serine/threonine-protein phosphatase [Burkholderiales bacterium]